jgi:transposase InsO family protein
MPLADHAIGRIVDLEGEDYEVVVHGPALVKLVSADGKEVMLSDKEFRLLVAGGKVRRADEAPSTGVHIPDKRARQEHRYRRAFLKELTCVIEEHGGLLPITKAIPIAHGRVTDKGIKRGYEGYQDAPSRRTVFLWRQMDQDDVSQPLVPKVHLRGNTESRHTEEFEEIVLDLLEEVFLRHDRISVTTLTDKAATVYEDRCAERGAEPGPCGRQSVEAILKTMAVYDILKRRLPPDEHRKRTLRAALFHSVKYPLDLVEIDCHTAKILLVDRQNRIVGRPTICAIIDVATGWILALVVSLTAPKGELVLRALKECLVPKNEAFFDRLGIENRTILAGIPKTISSDQGSENGGDAVEAFVVNSRSEWHKCMPKHPEDKPHIERFFRELKRFVCTLDGATESVLMKRRTRTELAEQEACLTVEEFDQMIQKWRYDVYGVKTRRRVASPLRVRESPIESWKRLEQTVLLPLPPTPEELRDMFMISETTRVLHKYGVEVGGFQYYSKDLEALIAELGDGQEVEVRYDPSDAREIAVLNPKTRTHFPVRSKDPTLLAVGFEEAKTLRRKSEAQKRSDRRAGALVYDLALESDRIRQAKGGKTNKKSSLKQARAEEQTRLRHQEILDRSAQPPSVNPAMTAAAKVPSIRTPISRPSNIPDLIDME